MSDSSIGRLNYATLPQNALMEHFSKGITNIENVRCGKTETDPLDEWRFLTFTGEKEIEMIIWTCASLEGSVDLQ